MLRVDVTKQLGEFSLAAAFESEGRVTGLFGASGAGKTSLVNMIAGLLRPDRGTIAIDGETLDDTASGIHVPTWRRRIGYVFQDARLFPHLDVRQNLDYGRRMNGCADDAEQNKRVTDLLDIGHLLDRRPGEIIGRRAPARRARPRAAWRNRGCSCSTSRSARSTRDAARRSCPIWCGCATRPAFPWSMSAMTPPRCGSSQRRSCCCSADASARSAG